MASTIIITFWRGRNFSKHSIEIEQIGLLIFLFNFSFLLIFVYFLTKFLWSSTIYCQEEIGFQINVI